MHLVDDRPSKPVESVTELVDYFVSGCKPREEWRIGTEHEMIGVYSSGDAMGAAPPYEGDAGIGAIFGAFADAGWNQVYEDDTVIALMCAGAQMTFEPGGQLEHALRPLRHADDLARSISRNVEHVARVSHQLGLSWLQLGFRPFGRLEDGPWMPKQRYRIMRDYLPTRGNLALEMMKRTATVQTNLDYSDERDAAEKLRCLMSVTSLLTAIYANSPIVDEEISGYQSYRARIWLDTDPDRCGLLPFVFDGDDVFSAYTEWALDVPMFFVHRGIYKPAGGMTFRRFLRDGFEGARATIDDWALHLSTLFPEGRLKRYIEVRGCDTGSFEMIAALSVLTRGLLYDDTSRAAATALTAKCSLSDRLDLLRAVPKRGFAAEVGQTGYTVGELADELMTIATDGARRSDPSELPYLEPVRTIVGERRTQADRAVDLWRRHQGDRRALIRALSYPGLGRPAV